jgi:DNA repair exonuclease SbcCD nuclease subunit
MKILHTADLHLRSENDERWAALTAVVDIGKKQKVDVLVIAGDLFDSALAAGRLYDRLRPVFSDTGFPILILPGNHDHDSYPTGIFLGDGVSVLSSLRDPIEIGGVRFWGLPFVPREQHGVLALLHSIRELVTPEKPNILLYHGELTDKIFERSDLGDEGAERYMPARLSHFADFNFAYVLSGHFHTSFDIFRFGDGGYFVYPGSPVSITKRETGQRAVNLFEVGKTPARLALDTAHYVWEEIACNPFSDEDPVSAVKQWTGGLHPNAAPLLSVTGFIDGARMGTDETKLIAEIRKAAGKRAEIDYRVRDISTILGDDLFAAFRGRLAAAPDLDEQRRERITRMVIGAMMEADR